MEFDLSIKRDKRNKGNFVHKTIPKTHAHKSKAIALHDITDAVGEGFYNRNYLHVEYQILRAIKDCHYEIIPLNI